MYLENKKSFPSSIPEAKIGRWLTMDAGDFDNDRRPILVLEIFLFRPVDMKHPPEWKTSPPFILPKDIGKWCE
jgi:hypothetical protein